MHIESIKFTVAGSLISSSTENEDSSNIFIFLNPAMLIVFKKSAFNIAPEGSRYKQDPNSLSF